MFFSTATVPANFLLPRTQARSSNYLFKTYFVYFSVNMGQEAKTAVEAIKIEDTCYRENICLIVMKPKTNFGIKIMMHVRKMF